jgi:transposase InsO family protein
VDWNVFKSLTNIPDAQIAAHIYNNCDSSVQSSIINTSEDFFALDENNIFELLEKITTKRSNPSVHRLTFSNLTQSEGEPVKDFVVRLKSHARDCEFACPNCKHDLVPVHVKDQLVRGIHNSTLQTDILAKSETLKDLADIVKHAQSFETALDDQSKLQNPSDVMAARTTDYKRMSQERLTNNWNNSRQPSSGPGQQSTPPPKPDTRNSQQQHRGQQRPYGGKRTCGGCGAPFHSDRPKECPAWGKQCHNCNTPNHFSSVCRQPKRDSASAIIAHVKYDEQSDFFTSATPNREVRFIPAKVTPLIGGNQLATSTVQVFPDSGADICLAGTRHLKTIGVEPELLTPCRKTITAVGGATLTCRGWVQCEFEVGGNTTRQPVYICEKVDRIYFGREACTEVTILPQTFPFPMKESGSVSSIEPDLPPRPDRIPFSPTDENVPKLKAYLVEKFADSVFNRTTPFRMMNCQPAHIHLRDDAKPYATHNPFSIPIHWQEEVKRKLDKDVEDGVIEPVPIGEPVRWCSPMVVTAKSDGSPRRTVDLQKLNQQCLRETHHCRSPFWLANQVPHHTKKSVLDATDGFHAIDLDEESRPLTTFITEWGRYRYRRLPQGYSASQDAYTRRYDDIIKDVPDKVKCIDDTLLYSQDIESAFFAVFDYLALCARSGITINQAKFKFCQDTVTFAGLRITPDGICPSDELLAAIKSFPTPRDIHGARSWFGAVNQIAWAYATSPIMQPFRNLVKPNMTFAWDEALDKLFLESKELLIRKCTAGIRAFELNRRTCLQTDWSKTGIGYLLLQQHCDCDTAKAPVCCKDGWKLVFAGSRFTTDAETRYAPTEGEALAIAWSLQHARMFVLGCKDLMVSTDHRPLLGILKDRDLNSITNPRIFNLKEKTLPYTFTIQYNPGKWHRGPDAFSRNPVAAVIAEKPKDSDDSEAHSIEEMMAAQSQASIAAVSGSDCDPLLTIADIHAAAARDATHQLLHDTVAAGFPTSRDNLKEELRVYWAVKDRLSLLNDLIMMGDRIVIPTAHRKSVLDALHAAHQGTSSMLARAQRAVYWPGIDADIRNRRYTCQTCNETAPSNPKEPLCLTPPPLYPYQKICLDFFHMGHHTYLSCVDRFSGWITIHSYPNEATSQQLISACRSIFTAYGVAEEVSTDGGPQFTSHAFRTFLKHWGVAHRLSSAYYPQSNGRAELGVKSAKRIIRDNMLPNGSLDSDKAARAILQHRNTPLADLGMSPAQLLLHRTIRDHVPVNPAHYQLHRDWILSAEEREGLYAHRNQGLQDAYNRTAHPLQPLATQTSVMVQTNGKWDKSGQVVEVLPHRQYRIKVDGSGRVTLRNRRFLRPIPSSSASPTMIPSASGYSRPTNDTAPPANSGTTPESTCDAGERSQLLPMAMGGSPPRDSCEPTHNPSRQPSADESLPSDSEGLPAKIPKALRELFDHNAPGLVQQEPHGSRRTRSGRL